VRTHARATRVDVTVYVYIQMWVRVCIYGFICIYIYWRDGDSVAYSAHTHTKHIDVCVYVYRDGCVLYAYTDVYVYMVLGDMPETMSPYSPHTHAHKTFHFVRVYVQLCMCRCVYRRTVLCVYM